MRVRIDAAEVALLGKLVLQLAAAYIGMPTDGANFRFSLGWLVLSTVLWGK